MNYNNAQQNREQLPVRKVYTVEDIMEILGIGKTLAYQLVKEEHFSVLRIGGAIRVVKDSFEDWMASGGDNDRLLM